MKNGEYRIYLSIISLFVVLGIFLGAYKIYEKYLVEGELENKINSISTVRAASIEKKDGQYEIELEMEKVDNIQKVYFEIDQLIASKLKPEDYKLTIKNRHKQNLEDLYYHLQPAIYEALANKQFVWLDKKMAEESSDAGIAYKLFIDSSHIFIQFEDGESCFYKVLDRASGELE
jgi:hypothetical protein